MSLFGDDAVVFEVEIDLAGCMDLTQRRWFSVLNENADRILELQKYLGPAIPSQAGKHHGKDRLVINYIASALEDSGEAVEGASARSSKKESPHSQTPRSFHKRTYRSRCVTCRQ